MLARVLARAKSSEVNGYHIYLGASDMGRRLVVARLLARANSTEVNGYRTYMGASDVGRRLVQAMSGAHKSTEVNGFHTYMGAHKSTEVNGYRKSCANLIRRAMQQLNGPNDGAMRITKTETNELVIRIHLTTEYRDMNNIPTLSNLTGRKFIKHYQKERKNTKRSFEPRFYLIFKTEGRKKCVREDIVVPRATRHGAARWLFLCHGPSAQRARTCPCARGSGQRARGRGHARAGLDSARADGSCARGSARRARTSPCARGVCRPRAR